MKAKKVKEYYVKGEFYDWVTHPKCLEKIFHRLRERATVRLIGKHGRTHSSILDIGCGTGLITRHMKDNVFGLDINRWNLKCGRTHAPKIEAILADAEKLPMRSRSIDMIICTETLEHLPNPQIMLQEIERTLKEGGILVGSTPSTSQIWKFRKILTSTCPVTEPFHHNYTINELRGLLQGIRGFKIVDLFKAFFQLTLFFVVEKHAIEDIKKLLLIVPTYMEAENTPFLAERLKAALKGYDHEALIVDDNSPDETWKKAKEEGFNVLVRPRKMGLASAFIEGIKHARAELIGLMDADLQHPPKLLPSMMDEAYDGADLVVGSRYVDGGGVEGWPFHRRVVSKCAVALAHLLLPRTRAIKDPMSGFFLVRRGVIEGVDLRPGGFKILLEILVKGNYGRVVEVPYTFRSRKRGKSKMDLKEMFKYVKHIYRLLRDRT